jgi:DNA-binding NarL/FixJ family response regulator
VAVRLLIADDHELVREGFAMILGAEPALDVVGEARDGEEAVAQAERLRPDVVLMDIEMPKLDGVGATRAILERLDPAPRVLIVTTWDTDEYVFAALRAGASGFVLKNAPAEDLVRAIHVIAEGEALLAPSVTRRLIEDFGSRAERATLPPAFDELTTREAEVLELVARGLSNAEIAERLVVSHGTVKTHVARILMKLGLRDRVQAVVLAYETGLLRPGEDNARG